MKKGHKMIIQYPVIFTKINDEKDTYLIEIPDLKGITEGYGLADAMKMAKDYIKCHCFDKAYKDLPKQSSIEEIDISKGVFSKDGNSDISIVDVNI